MLYSVHCAILQSRDLQIQICYLNTCLCCCCEFAAALQHVNVKADPPCLLQTDSCNLLLHDGVPPSTNSLTNLKHFWHTTLLCLLICNKPTAPEWMRLIWMHDTMSVVTNLNLKAPLISVSSFDLYLTTPFIHLMLCETGYVALTEKHCCMHVCVCLCVCVCVLCLLISASSRVVQLFSLCCDKTVVTHTNTPYVMQRAN